MSHLQQEEIEFIDFGDLFLGEDYRAYYQGERGHFTIEGNQRVATEVIRLIRHLDRG